MKKLLFLTGVLFAFARLSAQGFTGSIDFKYVTVKDSSANVYWVKNKLVKLDQYSKKGNTIEGSYIFDLNAGQIKFLSPKRKLWGFQKSETPPVIHGQCVVTKGGAKSIAGVKCTEYVVKNTEENTTIIYWIADGNYTFFTPLIKLWNHKGRQSIYFTQIKGLGEGAMPLYSEERQLSDGKLLSKLEVTKISKTPPEESNLVVPADYTKFDQ